MSNISAEEPKDYSWAEYLDCMEGGSDVVSLPQAKPAKTDASKPVALPDKPLFGFALAFVLMLIAVWGSELPVWPFTVVGGRHPIEPVMLAIILGMVLSNLWSVPKKCNPGIKFSVKKLLPLGIVFLGARLNFMDIVKVGGEAIVLTLLETVVAFSLLLWLAKVMKLQRKLGLLLAVGTAICGGTAIVATAPVIEAEEKDVVVSVATVTLLGLIGMFLLPVLGGLMHMSAKAFGVWAGLSIHQTPQVVAAGFSYHANGESAQVAGQTATIVKLARVCLLAPVVFIVGVLHARGEARDNGGATKKRINYLHLFPMFVFGFLAMALARTLGILPDLHFAKSAFLGGGVYDVNLAKTLEDLSKYCIVISMAGVGLETRFAAMRQTGLKPFVASLVAVLVVATMVLVLIRAMNIG